MSAQLPLRVEPLLLAQDDTRIAGSVALQALPRLQAMAPADGELTVSLHFGVSEERRPLLSGTFQTCLVAVCQRCLEPMSLPLSGDIRLVLVRDMEEADRYADRFDVLQVGDRPMSLNEILEDEVLLVIPAVPLHPHGECSAGLADDVAVTAEQPEQEQRPNPFAVLATLKQGSDPEPQ